MGHLRNRCITVLTLSLLAAAPVMAQPSAAPAKPPASAKTSAGATQSPPPEPAKPTGSVAKKPVAKKPMAASARAEALDIAREKLERADDTSVQDALASLASLGGEQATKLVVARVRKGLPPQLAEAAIDTLVLLGRPSASAALLDLALHSRAAIRARAIAAFGALRIRSAQSAVLFALDDPNPQVRVAAVAALGSVGDGRALPALYVAAERGADGAFVSIGMIARPADLKGLLSRAPSGDVSVIKPALFALMARKDFALEGKLRVVRELSTLATASARVCLVQWLEAYKADGPTSLRKALFAAIKHVDDLEKTKDKIGVETTGGKS